MAFATLTELKGRLEWDLDAGEERIAQGALDDLSADAAFYGRPWTDETVPAYIKTLVLKAAQRYMRNPDGYETSRAGDETLGWGERPGNESGAASFTDKEIAAIRSLIRPAVFGSVNVQAWGTKLPSASVGRVPVSGYPGERTFPYFSSEDGPW